jgi:hypothetical protein
MGRPRIAGREESVCEHDRSPRVVAGRFFHVGFYVDGVGVEIGCRVRRVRRIGCSVERVARVGIRLVRAGHQGDRSRQTEK